MDVDTDRVVIICSSGVSSTARSLLHVLDALTANRVVVIESRRDGGDVPRKILTLDDVLQVLPLRRVVRDSLLDSIKLLDVYKKIPVRPVSESRGYVPNSGWMPFCNRGRVRPPTKFLFRSRGGKM